MNIPELHLLIGIVDKLISGFENKVFETPEKGREWMDRYLKEVAIVRKSYQGCHSLEGNQSSSFLKKIDVLERNLFSNLYRQLDISVTPKVHILESHITDFYEISEEKVGLGFFSEQGFESMHHDMKVIN